nr:(dl)-glycerol-3-phosphatase 2 [Quercus suber]
MHLKFAFKDIINVSICFHDTTECMNFASVNLEPDSTEDFEPLFDYSEFSLSISCPSTMMMMILHPQLCLLNGGGFPNLFDDIGTWFRCTFEQLNVNDYQFQKESSKLYTEVKQGKPSPDIFLAASKRFEGGPVDSHKFLVFEDAPSGVNAAKNAGMSVVMVPDPRLDSSYHATADQVLSSLLDFNPDDWGLPPFEVTAS